VTWDRRPANEWYRHVMVTNSWWGCDSSAEVHPRLPYGYSRNSNGRKVHDVRWYVVGWRGGRLHRQVALWWCGSRSTNPVLTDDRRAEGKAPCGACTLRIERERVEALERAG
jgi:hypothetical protein